jgi:hypothetical protein
MRFPTLLAALLALAAVGTIDVFAPDGRRIGSVREGPGSRVDVYDAESRRVGWGRRNADGSVEVFDKKGKRIGTGTPDGRVIIQWPPERGRR